MGTEENELELGAADRDRLLHLIERKLPHLLDEPHRIDWYIAEVLSYWKSRPSARPHRRDWPMTVLNRMLRVELERHHGQLPNPTDVRAEQAERRLAEAAVRNADGIKFPSSPRQAAEAITEQSPFRPREIG